MPITRTLLLSGAIAAIVSFSPVAQAQSPQTPPADAQTRSGSTLPSDQQLADMVNARIATLKADLRLTEVQQGHWGALENVLRDTAIARAKQQMKQHEGLRVEREAYREAMRKWRDEVRNRPDGMRPDRPVPPGTMTFIEAMRLQSDAMSTRATQMRSLADAAAPLYATLDQDQKSRLAEGVRNIGDQVMRGMGRQGSRWRDDDGRDGRRRWRD